MTRERRTNKKSATKGESRRDAARVSEETRQIDAERRTDLLIVVCLLLLTGMLRGFSPERVSVEHYDEGVYASNQYFDEQDGYSYPDQHLYAPPLLPGLIEFTQLMTGDNGWAVNFLFGCGTVLLAWFAMKSYFGRPAAIAAAVLIATSDLHVLYSRTLLTDVGVTFWILLAVWFFERSLSCERIGWAVAAGVATGMAWTTKYSGWLPLAIVISGSIPWLVIDRNAEHRGIMIRNLITMVVVSVAVWSPVWFGLQDHGGYASVAQNHSKYVVGLTGWPESLITQLGNLRSLSSMLTLAGIAGAVGSVVLVGRGSQAENQAAALPCPSQAMSRPVAVAVVLCVAIGVMLSSGIAIVLAALINSIVLMWSAWRSRSLPGSQDAANPLIVWLMSAWLWGLALTTFLYTPYPRLLLPMLVVSALLTGKLLGDAIGVATHRRSEASAGNNGDRFPKIAAIVLLLVCGLWLFKVSRTKPEEIIAWEDRSSLNSAAESIVKPLQQRHGNRFVVYVLAEPGLFYHLRQAHAGVGAAGNVRFAEKANPAPTYLVVGPHGEQTLDANETRAVVQQRFTTESIIRYSPSTLVRSNRLTPDRFDRKGDMERITVYRLKP